MTQEAKQRARDELIHLDGQTFSTHVEAADQYSQWAIRNREILKTCLSQPATPEWKPIETAPKDGRSIRALGQNGKEDIIKWEDYTKNVFRDIDGEWNARNGEGPFTHWQFLEPDWDYDMGAAPSNGEQFLVLCEPMPNRYRVYLWEHNPYHGQLPCDVPKWDIGKPMAWAKIPKIPAAAPVQEEK